MRFVEILDKMHLKFFPNFTFTLHHLMTHIILFNSKESTQRILHVCGYSGIQNFSLSVRKYISRKQSAKKVVSDSLGLVDFAIGLVNSVFNLPDGQVMSFEEFE